MTDSSPELERLLARGDFASAQRLARSAWEESTSVEQRAQSVCDLLAVLIRTGRYRDAEGPAAEAQAIEQQLLATDFTLALRLLLSRAELHYNLSNHPQCSSLLDTFDALMLRRAEPSPGLRAKACHLRGCLAIGAGQLDRAVSAFEEAIALREALFGKDHVDVAESLHGLAVAHRRKGEITKARTVVQRSLAIKESVLGESHPDLARTLSSLGLLLEEQQAELAAAERLFQRAIAIAERGEESSELASYLQNLAGLQIKRGRFPEAEPLLARAVAIRSRVLGADHPSLSTARDLHGVVLAALGRRKEAASVFERAIQQLDSQPHASPAEIARVAFHAATNYLELQAYSSAEPLLRRTLTLRTSIYSAKHRESRVVEALLGLTAAAQGQVREGEAAVRRALQPESRAAGHTDRNTAIMHRALGEVLLLRGRNRRAARAFERGARAMELASSIGHPDTQAFLRGMGVAQLRAGRGEAAEAALLFAEALLVESFGERHPDLVLILQLKARALRAQGRREESGAALRRAFALLTELGAFEHPSLDELLDDLTADTLGTDRFAAWIDDVHRFAETVPTSSGLRTRVLHREARMRFDSGEVDTGIAQLRKVMVLLEKEHGAHSPEVVGARQELQQWDALRAQGVVKPMPSEAQLKGRQRIWNASTFLLSLFVFCLSLSVSFSTETLIIVVAALLFHELGHLLGMKIFGYRDLKLLFLPFLGAVAVGRRLVVPVRQRVLIYLLGPVPGVALGILGLVYAATYGPGLVRDASGILLMINAFNLLPVMPLDGGRVVNDLLFARRPVIEGIFGVVGGVLLLLWGLQVESQVLAIYGVVLAVLQLARLRERGVRQRLLADVLRWRQGVSAPSEREVRAAVLAILRGGALRQTRPMARYRCALRVYRVALEPWAAPAETASLLAVYLFWLLLSVPLAAGWNRTGEGESETPLAAVIGVDLERSSEPPKVKKEGGFERARRERSEGRFEDANRSLQELLDGLPETGADVERSVIWHELGLVRQQLGRFSEAEQAYQEALALRTELFGVQHQDVGETLERLGEVLLEQRRFDEAEESLAQAIEIRARQRGEMDRSLAIPLKLYIEALRAQREYGAADPELRRLRAILEAVPGKQDGGIVWTLRTQADNLADQKRLQEAEIVLKQYVARVSEVSGAESKEAAEAFLVLGRYYGRRGFYQAGEKTLMRALAMAEAAYAPDEAPLVPYLEELEFVYRGLRKTGPAEAVLARRAAISKAGSAAAAKADQKRPAR